MALLDISIQISAVIGRDSSWYIPTGTGVVGQMGAVSLQPTVKRLTI
jgi:hypothetical protein